MSDKLTGIPSYLFLLQRLKENDPEAFKKIYDRFWEDLYLFAYNVLKDETVCNDIVQDIFVDLWERRHKTEIQNLPAYLRRAVKFRCLKHIRSGKIAQHYIQRIEHVHFINQTEETIYYEELNFILGESIDQLPAKCKEIFRLSRFQHLSHQEIADQLGLSLQTVKNQISKACQYLKSSVGDIISILLTVILML